jgi:pyruvate ferredoxin oxidoreductase gamma subunit
MAALDSGKAVQAFPEFGPERSGAPMQAYNRIDGAPIRRRFAVQNPDVVVVLDPSLLSEVEVTAGLGSDGLLLVNTGGRPGEIRSQLGYEGDVLCVPGDRLAAQAGARFTNVVMLGALAAALGEPPPAELEKAARGLLGQKLSPAALESTLAALAAGHRFLAQEELPGRRVACLR